MLLAIAIISGLGVLFSLIVNASHCLFNANWSLMAVFTLSTWNDCLPLAIITMSLAIIIFLFNLETIK